MLYVAGTACNAAAVPSTGSQTPAPSDDSALRYLMERVIGGFFVGLHLTEIPRILPGQLPRDFDIPLPEGSAVVGSVLMAIEEIGDIAQVVLDVPGGPEAAFSSLTNALAAEGWQSRDEPRGMIGGGFISSSFAPYSDALFCSETVDGSLNVSVFPLGEGLADLRLHLLTNARHSPCEMEPPMRGEPGHGDMPFPPLNAPPGVQQSRGGSGSGTSAGGLRLTFHTDADLLGAISAEQTEAHYREQLTEAGWILLDNNTAGPSAWSTWRFTDDGGETWGAMLLIIKSPWAEDSLFAFLRASR